ncbi:MAG: flagellar protein FlaG [Halochromatium sp.]|uniref:flagellar protein FlaG n=1 Tax=Halochromatium sp. TaxID=2049430 RepID=UPI00397CE783
MSSSIADISQTAPKSAPVNQFNPRERLEDLLEELPTAGGALAQAESNQAPGRSDLEEAVQRVNEVMNEYGVQFELSDPGERLIIRVVDRESGELIRQVPPEEILRIAQRIEEMQSASGGLLSLEA